MSYHKPSDELNERKKAWLQQFCYINKVRWQDASYILSRIKRIEDEYFAEQAELDSEYQYAENWEQDEAV